MAYLFEFGGISLKARLFGITVRRHHLNCASGAQELVPAVIFERDFYALFVEDHFAQSLLICRGFKPKPAGFKPKAATPNADVAACEAL
jgi:hypothetical protein